MKLFSAPKPPKKNGGHTSVCTFIEEFGSWIRILDQDSGSGYKTLNSVQDQRVCGGEEEKTISRRQKLPVCSLVCVRAAAAPAANHSEAKVLSRQMKKCAPLY